MFKAGDEVVVTSDAFGGDYVGQRGYIYCRGYTAVRKFDYGVRLYCEEYRRADEATGFDEYELAPVEEG